MACFVFQQINNDNYKQNSAHQKLLLIAFSTQKLTERSILRLRYTYLHPVPRASCVFHGPTTSIKSDVRLLADGGLLYRHRSTTITTQTCCNRICQHLKIRASTTKMYILKNSYKQATHHSDSIQPPFPKSVKLEKMYIPDSCRFSSY